MNSRTEAILLRGNDVSVALVRRVDPDGISTSGTTVWLTQRFGVARGAESFCVSDASSLGYTISHQNSKSES